MSQVIAIDSRFIADELYHLLSEIDPARWKNDLEAWAQERLELVNERLNQLLKAIEHAKKTPAISSLHVQLCEIATLIEKKVPERDLPVDRIKEAWEDFHRSVLPAYEHLAKSLKKFDIHVPSLRPSNYWRNVFHASNGIFAVFCVQHLLSPAGAIWLAGTVSTFFWSLEISRRFFPELNKILMKIFGKVAHPHETWRVNSGTWYGTALFLLSLAQNFKVVSVALIILAFADPMAAIIGRRFGRIRLVNGRSLEGSLTFIVTGFVAAITVLAIYYPEVSWGAKAALALGGAIPSAVAELVSRRIDDNLSIPLSAGAGALAMVYWLGIA